MVNVRCFLPALALFIGFSACEKQPSGWDDRLNGRWVEIAPNNAKSLPAGCEILLGRSFMSICDENVVANLNSKAGVNSAQGQIWINYRLGGQRHSEYRYDYAFDGDYLWLSEDQSSDYHPLVGIGTSKKYRKK